MEKKIKKSEIKFKIKKNINNDIEELNKNPTIENWDKLQNIIKIKKIKYYKIIYPDELKGKNNLIKAYAILYDSYFKAVFKVPVISNNRGKIEGATIFLKGLTLNTR
ncbi:MAG: hypothetical protein M1168_02365 [Candidatus Marsarchaeota archaeon]|jgi:hypothetical protein|nr:hypothetical protein [Candidatus Marsarchaeota archaeon]MCL5094803.1 hypothetical protein [Candidatus Marsarchaeota archaeon]